VYYAEFFIHRLGVVCALVQMVQGLPFISKQFLFKNNINIFLLLIEECLHLRYDEIVLGQIHNIHNILCTCLCKSGLSLPRVPKLVILNKDRKRGQVLFNPLLEISNSVMNRQ
jgi:hypothetical protein